MRRRPADLAKQLEDEAKANERMIAFVGADKPKAKKGARDAAGMARAMDSAKARLEEGAVDWEDATASEVVGLYALLHERVYGVSPDDLADKWRWAVAAAKRLADELGGTKNVVAFLQFTWKRERAAEAKANGTGHVRRRVTWRYQFAERFLLVDFKRAIVATRPKS
jgi:hypothetical protein